MTKRTSILVLPVLAACATAGGWQANQYEDEFTGTKSCRVEIGSRYAVGYRGTSFLQFYAENYNGQARAGVRSINGIPIAGDVQLKVGSKLYTLTSQNVPLDAAPVLPDLTGPARQSMGKGYADSMKAMTREIQKMGSPYRAYTGGRAKALLRDMVNTDEEIKFRTVGINAAASTTASFKAGADFRQALHECGIAF